MRETDPRLARLLLVIAIFAVYMPLMGGGFVWDDHLLIVDNPIIKSLANIPQMFATDLWGTTDVAKPDGGYYRPLMLVDLSISHALVGLNHRLYHLHNLLWHGVAVVLMVFTLERLIKAGDVTVYRNKLKPSERRFSIPELRALAEYRPGA